VCGECTAVALAGISIQPNCVDEDGGAVLARALPLKAIAQLRQVDE
jgi:hypothetical protein